MFGRMIGITILTILFALSIGHAEPKVTKSKLSGVATRPLPEVKTLADLEASPLVTLPAGDQVHVGVSPADPGLGPWRVVYCLVDVDSGKDGAFGDESYGDFDPLGPLLVRPAWASDCGAAVASRGRLRYDAPQNGRQLFSTLVPLCNPDREYSIDVRLIVLAPGNTQFETPRADVERDTRSPWRPMLACREPSKKDDPPVLAMRTDAVEAVPTLNGDARVLPAVNVSAPATQPAASLGTPERAIELSLEDGSLHIETGRRTMPDSFRDVFLVRWWSNGKPVTPPIAKQRNPDEAMMDEQAMTAEDARRHELKVPLKLPVDLRSAKAGDTVAVQVIYSAGGFAVMDRDTPGAAKACREHDELHSTALEFAISNRLDIVMTPELLAQSKR